MRKCKTTLKTAVWMDSLKTIHLKNQSVNHYVAVVSNIIWQWNFRYHVFKSSLFPYIAQWVHLTGTVCFVLIIVFLSHS